MGPVTGPSAAGILAVSHPSADTAKIFERLQAAGVTASLRHARGGKMYLRWSPHFYNTEEEIEWAVEVVREAL